MLPFNEDAVRETSEISLPIKATGSLIQFSGIFIAPPAIIHGLRAITLANKYPERMRGLKIHDGFRSQQETAIRVGTDCEAATGVAELTRLYHEAEREMRRWCATLPSA